MTDQIKEFEQPLKYLPLKEVLCRYSIGRTTAYRWMAEGKLPKPVKLGPRTVRWRESDLLYWEQGGAEE